MRYKLILLFTSILLLSCCGQKNATKEQVKSAEQEIKSDVSVPSFNADSAYTFVAQQVEFGYRIPNSEAHNQCAHFLAVKLESQGAKVFIQEAVVTAYNKERLNIKNIIGSYNPDNKRRILLCAHWDSRPYADHDDNEANHNKPIYGADDGASGVGVLLEIARQISENQINTGIDIVFFDAEDYGTPEYIRDYSLNTWCLGSQFWAKKTHIANYEANFGILLDMVGAKGASFYKEYTSVRYASQYVELVWNTAKNLGYGKYFINAQGGNVIDDHKYVLEGRKIPCIDIINYAPSDPDNHPHGFAAHWHTVNDNINIIDKGTLKAVGQTVLDVIYKY
ncbi:MAG: M28 family peptidase [Tannerella sp.]|jgi:Zn-dependent M28 family amino/carboxypeptidase|nr:M28 family peptidase [Tannerella sp.]